MFHCMYYLLTVYRYAIICNELLETQHYVSVGTFTEYNNTISMPVCHSFFQHVLVINRLIDV